jgi:EmrB/QacA subfamily drug resistance transporter
MGPCALSGRRRPRFALTATKYQMQTMQTSAPRNPMLVPMVVACAFFIENFDSTVITTALPAMAESFGTNPIELSSGITAYLLSVAIFIPISGWLADRFGARNVFRAAIGLFTVASLLCGLSQTPAQFLGARILQGIGGAMMVPVGRLIVLRSVSKKEFVRAMSYVTVPSVLGQVLGSPVGGFLTTYVSWPWIFFLNIPIGLIGMVLVSMVIGKSREPAPAPFDWVGFFLTGAAIGSLMYGFELVVGSSPAKLVAIWLALGLVLGALAVRHARRHPNAVIDLSLVKVPTFGILLVTGFGFRMAFGAVGYLLPLQMQLGFGMSAFASGVLTFFVAVGTLLMKTAAPRVLRHFGFRRVLIANGVICAVAVAALAFFTPSTPVLVIAMVLFASGIFRSLGYTAINTVAYADIAPQRMSRASSFAGTSDRVAMGAGVSFGAILLHAWTQGSAQATPDDFLGTLIVVACLTLLAVVPCLWLAHDAGSELSGHVALGAKVAKDPRGT